MTSIFRQSPRDDGEHARDAATLGRLTSGDDAALAELYERHANHVYALALRVVGSSSDAEEVTEDVFAQAWRQAARYDASRGAVAAWLLNMARTRAIDRLRMNRARPALGRTADHAELARLPGSGATQEQAVLDDERRTIVRQAVSELDAKQRTALELAYFSGLTHVEIAEHLSEPLGTVKTRIRSALIKLRDVLGREWIGGSAS